MIKKRKGRLEAESLIREENSIGTRTVGRESFIYHERREKKIQRLAFLNMLSFDFLKGEFSMCAFSGSELFKILIFSSFEVKNGLLNIFTWNNHTQIAEGPVPGLYL